MGNSVYIVLAFYGETELSGSKTEIAACFSKETSAEKFVSENKAEFSKIYSFDYFEIVEKVVLS